MFEDFDEKEWLALHHDPTILTASQMACVLNIDEWTSGYTLFYQKKGSIPWAAETRAMRRGHHMEPFIHDEYERQEGVKLIDPGEYRMFWQHGRGNILATPDRFILDTGALVNDLTEFKAPGVRAIRKWENDGPPLGHEVQVQIQLYCTGAQRGTIVALVGNDLLVHAYDRNDKLIALIIEQAEAFLLRLKNDDPPDPDDTASTTATLKKLHPEDNDLTVELPEEAIEMATKLWEAKATIKEATKTKTGIENWFKDQLGPGAFGVYGKLKASWKTSDRKGYEVKPSKPRTLRVTIDN